MRRSAGCDRSLCVLRFTALRSADMVKASRPSALGAGVSPVRWPGSERRGKWGGGGGGPRERCRDASHLGKFNQWARASGASNASPRSAVARAALRWWELPDEPSPGGHEDPREPATRRARPLAASFGPSRRRYRGGRAVPGGFPGRRCPPAFQKAGTHGSQARQAPVGEGRVLDIR